MLLFIFRSILSKKRLRLHSFFLSLPLPNKGACSFFTTNIDFEELLLSFVDTTIEEDGFYTELCGLHRMGPRNFKANTRYNLSTKILMPRTASGISPAENMFCFSVIDNLTKPPVPVLTFHKFEVVKIPLQKILKTVIPIKRKLPPTVLPAPNPLVITLDHDDDARWGGWKYLITPDVFIYKSKKTASPFILGEGNRIVEDDIFLVNLFFSSNVDMDFLQIVFIDNTVAVDNFWTHLSSVLKPQKDIKAGIENKITVKVLATNTASGISPVENQFYLMAGPGTKEQPVLLFTKFEVVKI